MRSNELRRGDLVEVRSAREILATLDATGSVDGMPFMAEMATRCGKRYRVDRRTEKICDTITGAYDSRRLARTVMLDDARCDGSAHEGCQAMCRICWNEAWLRRVEPSDPSCAEPMASLDDLIALVSAQAKIESAEDTRFRCQVTEMVAASEHISPRQPASYLREVTTRNVPVGHFIRVMGRAVTHESLVKMGRMTSPVLRGNGATTPPSEPLDLQAGDWVRVKSPDEIRALLNDEGKNRGLWFDREMLPYCGLVRRVLARVRKIIDERTGDMLEFSSDCIVLEGTACSGERSTKRWFCPREIYPYWREAWLERVEAPTGSAGAVAIHGQVS